MFEKIKGIFQKKDVKKDGLSINVAPMINTLYSNEAGKLPNTAFGQNRNARGIQVYSTSQIMRVSARGQDGLFLSWGIEQPYFYLTAEQRNAMYRLSSLIFGIVSARQQRISSLDFDIVPMHKHIDEEAEKFKEKRDLYNEFKSSLDYRHIAMKAKAHMDLLSDMPELQPDFSNFDNCLLRWKRRNQRKIEKSSDEIKEWLMEPNQGVTWEAYIKKVVADLHIHGACATYKDIQDSRLENFDTLVGGTVFKIKTPYFSNVNGYIQVIYGFEPQILFENEIAYMEYLPASFQAQPMVPLEALINMIAETLLFDGRMSEVADGTVPPEKMVIITDNSPFGSPDQDKEFSVPLNPEEQKRIETKINEPRKNAIITFSGNSVEVVDLHHDDKWDFHNTRKKDIREEVGLVFNATNVEINLTGSDSVSGRNTAEVQTDMAHEKGIYPILKLISSMMTKSIIPHRYGSGWMFEFAEMKNEMEEVDLNAKRLANGEITVNELREQNGSPIFPEEQYNRPMAAPPQQQPGESNNKPVYMKSV